MRRRFVVTKVHGDGGRGEDAWDGGGWRGMRRGWMEEEMDGRGRIQGGDGERKEKRRRGEEAEDEDGEAEKAGKEEEERKGKETGGREISKIKTLIVIGI